MRGRDGVVGGFQVVGSVAGVALLITDDGLQFLCKVHGGEAVLPRSAGRGGLAELDSAPQRFHATLGVAYIDLHGGSLQRERLQAMPAELRTSEDVSDADFRCRCGAN